jgi:hypothetical protein
MKAYEKGIIVGLVVMIYFFIMTRDTFFTFLMGLFFGALSFFWFKVGMKGITGGRVKIK